MFRIHKLYLQRGEGEFSFVKTEEVLFSKSVNERGGRQNIEKQIQS